MLPNFLIIGAMKAGTSSLWHYLRHHPQIYLAKIKELNFFNVNHNWERGWSWYESQFEIDKPDVRAIGEASTNYSKYPTFPEVSEKIAAGLPNVKLIYVVRDPIERIRSMYVHMISDGFETKPFDEIMKDLNNRYVHWSCYYLQLSQYLAHFDKSQILVIATEDLRQSRAETMKRVFRFIGVEDSFDSTKFDKIYNRSSNYRQKKPIGKLFKKLALDKPLLRHLPGPARRIYKKVTSSTLSKPSISDDLRERLLEVIRPDVERLRQLVEHQFEFWRL